MINLRARSRIESERGGDFAPDQQLTLTVDDVMRTRSVLLRVVQALRNGATSARSYYTDGDALTYADGWAAATTLAALTAAEALGESIPE